MAETVPTPSGDNNVSNSDSIQLKDKLDYAWKWFEYHAGQRLVAFNFLLVLMGALSVGYYKAYDAASTYTQQLLQSSASSSRLHSSSSRCGTRN